VGCGRTLTDTVVAPGDSLILLTIRPRQWNAKYHFRWSHYWAPTGSPVEVEPAYVVPAWALPRLEAAAFVEHYTESAYLQPRTLEPDLDGDDRADLAVAIEDHAGRPGVAIFLSSQPGFLILGAGMANAHGNRFERVVRWHLRRPAGVAASPHRLWLAWADGTEVVVGWFSGSLTIEQH
jgi:hypothetical protein